MFETFLCELKNIISCSSYVNLKSIIKNMKFNLSLSVPIYLKTILSVEGSITLSECKLLYDIASQIATGCIVEIGSYRGRSTVALSLGSLSNSRVPLFAIDPHEPFLGINGKQFGPEDRIEFFKNILKTGVGEIVHLINLKSEVVAKCWDREISILWIDGDHRYQKVKKDYKNWESHIIKNGYLLFHDSTNPNLGPYKVVISAINSGKYKKITQVNSIQILQKK